MFTYCGISTDNKAKCYGKVLNAGQYGYSNKNGYSNPQTNAMIFPNNGLANDICSGFKHTCALMTNGDVYCFGNNENGRLGQGSSLTEIFLENLSTPVNLGTNFIANKIYCGNAHTCVVSTQNDTKCWGRNVFGQLGYNDKNHRGSLSSHMGDNLPIINIGTNWKVKSMSLHAKHTCAVSVNNDVKCWGDGDWGKLGQGNTIEYVLICIF